MLYIADTHCDTLLGRSRPNDASAPRRALDITPEGLRAGGVTLQVCALFAGSVGPSGVGENAPRAMANAQLAALHQLTDAGIRQVDSPFDAKPGEHCLMLSIEGGEIIGDSLDTLRYFRKLGVRLLALTWNYENLLAYPHCAGGQHGLKPFGWEVVREMNRLGIAADVSHLGEGGFWDLIFHNDKPPMASHSCCRKLRNHTRNLTDDQIRALIDRGGWIGVNFYTAFLTDTGHATAETVVDHIAHIAKLGGIGHVGFGSDFDGIDSAPVDVSNASEIPNLLAALRRRGFSETEIEGIAGGNFLRYMRQFEEV
ncbi:MAG: dipeptidase [Oscillospiraceae bacterium]|jgi:membrane dipeptidase|nr:dipeptidase [Oscillospiraceae bacterium]